MNLSIKSFASGELAPSLYARTDLARYEIGLRRCRNWFVMRQGGASRRPGTEYLGAVKDSTTRVRLIPFVFNVRQTFVLEFGDRYVRFWQNGGQVVDEMGALIEVVSPYVEADLADLQYVQSADVITIVHPSHPPYELKRLSNTNWTLTAIVFGPDIAPPTTLAGDGDGAAGHNSHYVCTAVSASGDESLASDSLTFAGYPTSTVPIHLTALAPGAVICNVYRSDDFSGVFGFVGSCIGEGVDFTDYGVIPDFSLQPPIDQTLFASENNYPGVVAYYQQRLFFANSTTNPDTIWASRTGHYHNFTKSIVVQDDDPITFRMVAGEVNAVRHLIDLGRLLIGTEGGASLVEGDGNGTVTPIAISPRAISYGGMGPLKPVKSGANMLYAQAMGSSVRELQSSTSSASGTVSLAGGDVTIFSSHLVDGFSIVDWAFQEEPLHIVWAVRSDGVLLGLTYIPEQQVLAWHRHDTLGFVENVCVVPEGRGHALYWVARRLINGSYRRYIERLASSNVAPVFATPDEAAQGPIVTPPPPPPPPPPSPTPVLPPTSLVTTDIGATTATANWIAGNLLAPTDIEIRIVGSDDTAWVATTVAGGVQSYVFTGLTPNVAYEWRVQHDLSGTVSSWAGPASETQFTTAISAPTLLTPTAAPVVSDRVSSSGFTDITMTWPLSTETADSEIQIAGPSTGTPVDGDYTSLGSFAPTVGTASQRIEQTGTYWLRVRYTKTGFDVSAWAGPSSWDVNVVDQV